MSIDGAIDRLNKELYPILSAPTQKKSTVLLRFQSLPEVCELRVGHVYVNVRLLPRGTAHAQALLQLGRAFLLHRGPGVQRGHHPGGARIVAAGTGGPLDRGHRAPARRRTALLLGHRFHWPVPRQGGQAQTSCRSRPDATLHVQLAFQRYCARRMILAPAFFPPFSRNCV